MGKGSGRRPGEGYEDGWARIFGKPEEKQEQNQSGKNHGAGMNTVASWEA